MESLPERHPIIRGDQVFLRPSERSDLPTFVRWLADADVLHDLARRSPISLAAEEAWFERMLDVQGTTDFHFVICLLADGRAIGAMDLRDVDGVHGTAELGIVIGVTDEWDKGYGTDAVRALCAFGFDHLRLERIGLEVYDGNHRARRAYEKVGFVHEATLRRARYARGRHEDVHVLSVLRDEWVERHRRAVEDAT